MNNYQDGTLEVKLNAVGAEGETVMFSLKDKEGKKWLHRRLKSEETVK